MKEEWSPAPAGHSFWDREQSCVSVTVCVELGWSMGSSRHVSPFVTGWDLLMKTAGVEDRPSEKQKGSASEEAAVESDQGSKVGTLRHAG